MMGLRSIAAASLLALHLFSPYVAAVPAAGADASAHVQPGDLSTEASSSWWFANIKRQGAVPVGGNVGYQIFRNVKDFGAKGDGVTDDTAAINAAISSGGRCQNGCDSSTTSPAVIYFPEGTYLVSAPIIAVYYSQLVGDVNNIPVIKASPNFQGIAVFDMDPTLPNGEHWYTNQNNFFRMIANFKIDITGQPITTGTCLHHEAAQATTILNVEFIMSTDPSPSNAQQGIFMDNGSGGHMADLKFTGGRYGMWVGNQQFTSINLSFNGCRTAIFMNWNWSWTFTRVTINNAQVGIDMTSGGAAQAVGNIVLLDSTMSNVQAGVLTNYDPNQSGTNGTLILDNVDFSQNTPVAVKEASSGATVLAGNAVIAFYVQGRVYAGTSGQAVQAVQPASTKPSVLLDATGKVVVKTRPQYNDVPASQFVSVKDKGAKGDGVTDDTAALQAVFDSVTADQIVFFDYGMYIVTQTIKVPKDIKIVGEGWPVIAAGGTDFFQDQNNPKPVFQVGQAGDTGVVEIQDLVFMPKGPQPGAILLEFNVEGASPGAAALWGVHFRIGGSAGSDLQSDKCSKNPSVIAAANPDCVGVFLAVHLTCSSSAYLENSWIWNADHELDRADHNQINVFSGRGMLVESSLGAWLWATAVEHFTLVNYNLFNAQNVFLGLIQTETPYFQGNPVSTDPFTPSAAWGDPSFTNCGSTAACARSWGFRAVNSTGVHVYGAGLYSFFNNYNQDCVAANNCQANMVEIADSNVRIIGLSTKAAVNMVTLNGSPAAQDKDNRNNFCATIGEFTAS